MKNKLICIIVCLLICCNAVKAQTLRNEVDSLSYALGIMFGANIQSGGFQTINAEIFGQTARKVLNNETLQMSQDEASSFINIMYHKAQRSVFEKNLVAGREFLRNNSSQPGVVTLPSGLQYKIITAGSGARPTPENRVTVHYHGTLIDGTVFDSSVQRGQTIEFGVTQVIRGWTEALQLMQVGAKWILYIPSELAYGETATGRIEPNSTLIFEVELFAIN